MGKLITAALLATVASAAASVSECPDLAEQELLSMGDECKTDGSDCALHALQRKGERVAAGEAESQELEEVVAVDVPPSIPDTGDYAAGLNIEELGVDELRRLVNSASQLLEVRQQTNQKYNPWPAADPNDAYLAASANVSSGCGMRPFNGNRHGTEMCFCQLAKNPACTQGCVCPQGCQGVTWSDGETVTFKNRARAGGCGPNTVLLTATKAYYRDTGDLKNRCGGGAVNVLATMLRNSWNHYQSKVAHGPVNQCFHNWNIASVKYLHMQTFCAKGEFHAMPTGNRKDHVGFCVTMTNAGQVWDLAGKLMAWL